MISPGSDYGKPLNTASNEIAPIYNYPVVAPKTPKLKRSEGIVHPRTGEEEMEVPNGCKGVRRFMFLTLRRCWRVSMSTPVEAEKKGEQALLSLALTTSLLAEIVLCAFIIAMVSYTEIDWVAYMQEVKGFLDGERNYFNLRGDTGPLVYPAGFLYIYSVMYWLSGNGDDIRTAQYLFLGLYSSLVVIVFSIYRYSGANVMPLWSVILVCASRRVHSIFVLRMFNDGVAMWLLYAAVYLFLLHRWRWGCAIYSLAVGVKMNILLFAPGLLLILLQSQGIAGAVVCLAICASVQLLLGAPFLIQHPVAYLSRSFELGRVFKYQWTVNLKFLDEETFVSPVLSVVLLALTVVALACFAAKWLREPAAIRYARSDYPGSRHGRSIEEPKAGRRALSPEYVVKTLFVSNFIGVVFCRSLHYQFYCWYYHTLPFLLWQTDIPVVGRLLLLAGLEYSFNIFPATPTSSLVLQVCHLVLLTALWRAPVSRDRSAAELREKKAE